MSDILSHYRPSTPALTAQEHEDNGFTRTPEQDRDLECASRDKLDLVLWNKAGTPVVVHHGDQDALIALMLKGKLQLEHFVALVETMEKHPESFAPLWEMFKLFVPSLSPEDFGRAKERLAILWSTEAQELRPASARVA